MTAAPRSVVGFTGLLAVAAAGGAAAMGQSTTWTVDRPWLSLPLVVALVLAGSLQLSFQLRRQVDAIDLFEAALTPVVFLFAGPVAIALATAAKFVSQVLLGVTGIKRAFNTAQWAAAAAAGSAVFGALDPGGGAGGRLPGLVAAMVVVSLVNHTAVAIVLSLVERRSLQQTVQGLNPVVPMWVVGGAVNISFGVLFTAAISGAPVATVLVPVPLIVLHWAQRAYAAARSDRARLDGLQRATHALAQPVDPWTALPTFMLVVQETFDAETAELVEFATRRVERAGRLSNDDAAIELARQLVKGGTPVGATAAGADDELAALMLAAGHSAAIAAPIFEAGEVVGALCAYDQGGFQGFSSGELAVLVAMGTEVESARQKSKLLATLVDERHKLSEIIGRSSDGIFTIDASGGITSWNPAMEHITGYTAADMSGPGRIAVLRARSDDNDVLLERWADGIDLADDIVVLDRTGDERCLSCNYSVSSDGDDAGMLIVVARDVTQAREVERLRDEFVATVSHELRTPLTTIRGFSTLLLEPPRPLTDEQRAEALGYIRKGARRLERLITNLLEVSRIERRTPSVPISEPVLVAPLCHRVVEEMRESHPQREFRLEIEPGIGAAHAHELSVERILVNVLSNAVKYAPDGDPLVVSVTARDHMISFTVSDHGPGVPPGEEERIFGRFQRIDLPGEQAGAGLGLYIARELAEAMGGELSVSPNDGGGARFTLKVPAQVIDLASL